MNPDCYQWTGDMAVTATGNGGWWRWIFHYLIYMTTSIGGGMLAAIN